MALHIFALASGALALVYEVLWMRRFTLLFGATALGAAATLSAFFLGMAIGSAVIGKKTIRWSRPLRAYGLLEGGIAVSAVAAELLLRLFERHYSALYFSLSGSPGAFLAVKVALSMAAIFVPTFFMGGTLPALAQAFAGTSAKLGIRAGGLYAMNTVGATVGALSVPFALLYFLGAAWSYRLATLGSLVVGFAAWRIDAGHAPVQSPTRESVRSKTVALRNSRLLAVFAFLSGVLLLGLEVFWTRMFALVHENSVHSFSIVVALFLLGLAGGTALAREFLRRGYSPAAGLTIAWSISGLLVLCSPRLFDSLSSGMGFLSGGFGILLPGLIVMIPALLVAGTILPFLMELAGGASATPAGPVLGRLMAVNTTGSIVGPMLAYLALNSPLGLWWNITVVGMVMLVAADVSARYLHGGKWRPSHRFGLYALVCVAVMLVSPGGRERVRLDRQSGERVVHLEEGGYGTVAVLEDGTHRWMKLNNYYVLGGTSSAREERQQAHLPLLLHPLPRSVAFLGLGTGITAGAALIHPVESLVAIEMVPEVIRAAKAYFGEANNHVLEDSRVRIVSEDARNYLKGSSRKFDVIIGDLVVPWRPGESSLLSLENFSATRQALQPGGIYCQWLPLFQLSDEAFRITVATFLEVYPGAMLWRGDFLAEQPAIALIGQRDAAPLDVAAVDERVQRRAARLELTNPYLSDPSGLWLFCVGVLDPHDARYFGARRNSDVRPWLELLPPPARDARPGEIVSALFEDMRPARLSGTPLERLDKRHLKWRDAGAELWSASVLASQGNDAEAQARAMRILSTLPTKLQMAILGRN